MAGKSGSPGFIWRVMRKLNGGMARNYQRGFGPAKVVMLLTTTGRKSGLPRITPLQFEEIDGVLYAGSARGVQSDWFRNIQADPCVQVQIRGRKFSGRAKTIIDPVEIADLLALRLKRHPIMIGVLMRLEGLPIRYTRADLERFAAEKAFVSIQPESRQNPQFGLQPEP
jgi:deazaflavin-dependent oxidoreductase (nitroreductase family)